MRPFQNGDWFRRLRGACHPSRFARHSGFDSQISGQDTNINLEELRQLANHLTTERLLSCQDLGDSGLGDSCFLAQLGLRYSLGFQ